MRDCMKIWDLFCRESQMVKNSWNVSFRIMCNLPGTTHRYFVEPISKMTHIKFVLIKNFLSFINQIKKSNKIIAKEILKTIENDVGSTTGSNLRNIMQLMNKNSIDQICINDIRKLEFANIPEGCEWRIPVLEELLCARKSEVEIDNFSRNDIKDMIEFICTS